MFGFQHLFLVDGEEIVTQMMEEEEGDKELLRLQSEQEEQKVLKMIPAIKTWNRNYNFLKNRKIIFLNKLSAMDD